MISRRHVLMAIAALALPIPDSDANSAESPKVARLRWIRSWVAKRRRSSDGELLLQRFKDEMYIVRSPISWRPGLNQDSSLPEVNVPIGFVTDLASVPPLFFSLLRPDGEYAFAAIIHDYLYWTQTIERTGADKVLKYSMQDFGVKSLQVASIISAVTLFGEGPWKENQRLQKLGEKRVLSEFPRDANTTWEIWKSKPEVFVP